MDLRHDGLCAASEIILAVEQTAKTACNPPVVGRVGRLDLSPNAMNVIPGEVQLGIDVRSISAKARATVIAGIRASISQITTARKIPYTIEEISSDQPAAMHPSVIQLLASLCEENQIPYDQLPSGAGHDIMHWADYAPCGMLFIPCRHGISHNPDEYASRHYGQALSQMVYVTVYNADHWNAQASENVPGDGSGVVSYSQGQGSATRNLEGIFCTVVNECCSFAQIHSYSCSG